MFNKLVRPLCRGSALVLVATLAHPNTLGHLEFSIVCGFIGFFAAYGWKDD